MRKLTHLIFRNYLYEKKLREQGIEQRIKKEENTKQEAKEEKNVLSYFMV